jgi:hypothetical protein
VTAWWLVVILPGVYLVYALFFAPARLRQGLPFNSHLK